MNRNKYFFQYGDRIYFIWLSLDEFNKLNIPTYPEFISTEEFKQIEKHMNNESFRDSIIAMAEQELGTIESPKGSNQVKYNDWFYPEGHPYFKSPKMYAWCGTFCSYVYFFAGRCMPTVDTDLGVCYIPTLYTIGKAKGWNTIEPKKGDLVLFDWEKDGKANHIGIFVEWLEKGVSFTCIEGNTSSSDKGSQSNGDGVYKKKRFVSNVLSFTNVIDI